MHYVPVELLMANQLFEDEGYDNLLVQSGLSSSIGFCQLKLKAGCRIERQLNYPKSTFYSGQLFVWIHA